MKEAKIEGEKLLSCVCFCSVGTHHSPTHQSQVSFSFGESQELHNCQFGKC